MPHPLAFPNSRGGFTDGNGNSVKEGDLVVYKFDNRMAILDEALHDGDAFITFEDGQCATVKWHHLAKLTKEVFLCRANAQKTSTE